MPTPKRKRCFLYYVYGYCLGFGGCIIAVIFAWTDEHTPNLSRALLTCALLMNLITLITQSVLTAHRFGPKRDIYRHFVNIIGLLITALMAGTGTFYHRKGEGLFFLCGVLATALYVMTCVAFTVSLIRTQAYKRQETNSDSQRRSSDWPERYQVDMITGGMPPDPDFGDVLHITIASSGESRGGPGLSFISSREMDPTMQYRTRSLMSTEVEHRDDGLSITQLALLGIPSNVFLPTYTEATGIEGESPPDYFEGPSSNNFDMSDLTSGTVVSPHDTLETGQPPDYEEIFRSDNSNQPSSPQQNDAYTRTTEESRTVQEQTLDTRL